MMKHITNYKLFENYEDTESLLEMIISDLEENNNIDINYIRVLPVIFECDINGYPKDTNITFYGMANSSLYNIENNKQFLNIDYSRNTKSNIKGLGIFWDIDNNNEGIFKLSTKYYLKNYKKIVNEKIDEIFKCLNRERFNSYGFQFTKGYTYKNSDQKTQLILIYKNDRL